MMDLTRAQQGAPGESDAVVVTSNNGVLSRGNQIHQTNPGPWGDLDFFYTYLEAPDSLIDLLPVPSQQTVWRFPGISLELVRGAFEEMGLSAELRKELEEHSIWHISDEGIRVHPSPKFVDSLPMQNRIALYRVLRRFSENPYHRNPIIIESGNVTEWFEGVGLSEHAVTAIEHLAYPLGNSLAFSDLPYLLSLMQSETEERAMLKAMTRTRTLILRLRIGENANFEALQDYWTAGFKYKDVLPIMESIQRVEGVERIDIAHLVPPLPRKLLYTFPSLSQGLTGRYPDSFWTALNFFEFWPKDEFLEKSAVERELRDHFEPIQPPFRYGDLLLLVEEQSRRAMHASVFIADDIVYTKNGSDLLRPWILMRLPDLMTRMATDERPMIEGWRRKPEANPTPTGP